ncbi:MAG: substrate-binding domain-containing protein [Ethanoligenens sp.]
MKSWCRWVLYTLLAALALSVTGCVAIKREKQVTVFADTSLKSVLNSAATALQKEDGLTLHIRYADTDTLERAVDTGARVDLLVLGGKSATPRGSYTFGSPAVRALMASRKVDNYANIAVGADGNAYSIAKPLSSKNYASAQTVVDFLLSKKGVHLLEANGFTLE